MKIVLTLEEAKTISEWAEKLGVEDKGSGLPNFITVGGQEDGSVVIDITPELVCDFLVICIRMSNPIKSIVKAYVSMVEMSIGFGTAFADKWLNHSESVVNPYVKAFSDNEEGVN